MKIASIPALVGAVALMASVAPAAQSAQNKQDAGRNAAPAHVACTKYGCFPVAPNCRPQTQLDWWGNPTGYDQIVCRPRRR